MSWINLNLATRVLKPVHIVWFAKTISWLRKQKSTILTEFAKVGIKDVLDDQPNKAVVATMMMCLNQQNACKTYVEARQ